jgi:spermidine synthase
VYFKEKHAFIENALKVKEKIFETQSRYQKIEVYKTDDLGNLMVIDDTAMLSDKDESTYHEMIVHVPLSTHKNPKKVLIIGGGDGGSAREVLKYRDIEVDMVDIDKEVVTVSKEYFPTLGDWDNPRLNLFIDDGVQFVKDTKDKSYDIVLVDSTDDKDHASVLFSKKFYKDIYRILKDDGLVSIQGSSWFVDITEHKKLLKRLGIFRFVMPYRYEMLTYPGVNWNFIIGSKKYHPLKDYKINNFKFNYYNEDIHKASFALPTYIKKELEGLLKL